MRSRRCTDGSSWHMLWGRYSIETRPPWEPLAGDAKSVPHARCYASPPPTEICAPSFQYSRPTIGVSAQAGLSWEDLIENNLPCSYSAMARGESLIVNQ